MSACSIILYIDERDSNSIPYSLSAILYFIVSISIAFYPLINTHEYKRLPVVIENVKLFLFFKKYLIILSYLSLLFYLPVAVSNLFFVNINYARYNNTMIINFYISSFGGMGKILNTVFSLIANMFPVTMAFSFLNLSISTDKKKYKSFIFSLVSTLSYFIYILAYSGRDGMVYWVLTFLIEYSMFKNYIEAKKLNRYLKLPLMIVMFCFLMIFVYITVGRFGENSSDFVWSIVNYMGQQIKNFSDIVFNRSTIILWERSIPANC
jgi:hypothetical protein